MTCKTFSAAKGTKQYALSRQGYLAIIKKEAADKPVEISLYDKRTMTTQKTQK